MTNEEAFSQALVGVGETLSDRMYGGETWVLGEFFKDKTEPYMEVIRKSLDPILERGLAKHPARTESEPTDSEGKTLLDSLLQKTTGWVTLKLYHGQTN